MKKKRSIKKFVLLVLAILVVGIPLYGVVSRYVESLPKHQYTLNENTEKNGMLYQDTSFAVISDLHYYDVSLGTTGAAFEECMLSDRKLLKDSVDILNTAIDRILKSDAKYVLIPGDLTKDAELICHQKAALALSRLSDAGIKAFVVPGNHDVNNPQSVRFEGDQTIPVEGVSVEQFAEIYKDFGYGNALYRDTDSLSYVATLEEDLWLIALDACRYKENELGGEEIVGGKLSQNQVYWLESMLKKANEANKAVMVMQHHGLVEHWKGQSKLHPDYLVEDHQHLSKLMASYGVRLAFTGHYHAQDIALANYQDKGFIYDIETGSLITAPCAMRFCSISENKINIQSEFLVGKLHPGTDFEEKAFAFVAQTIEREAVKTLKKYWVSDQDANMISKHVGVSFMAHYNGDEDVTKCPEFNSSQLGLWGRLIYSMQKYVVDGLWQDQIPADNHVVLDLSKVD